MDIIKDQNVGQMIIIMEWNLGSRHLAEDSLQMEKECRTRHGVCNGKSG